MKDQCTKPKTMWAYITLAGDEFHCYTSEKKARNFWAEQGKDSKRIRKVKLSWEKTK